MPEARVERENGSRMAFPQPENRISVAAERRSGIKAGRIFLRRIGFEELLCSRIILGPREASSI